MFPVIVFHKAHNLGHRIVPAGGELDWNDPQDCAFFTRTIRWSAARVEFRGDVELVPAEAPAAPAAQAEDAAAPTPAPKRRSKA
jgi:hypothetical protein